MDLTAAKSVFFDPQENLAFSRNLRESQMLPSSLVVPASKNELYIEANL